MATPVLSYEILQFEGGWRYHVLSCLQGTRTDRCGSESQPSLLDSLAAYVQLSGIVLKLISMPLGI